MKLLTRDNLSHDLKIIIHEVYGSVHAWSVAREVTCGHITRALRKRGVIAMLGMLEKFSDYEIYYEIRYKEKNDAKRQRRNVPTRGVYRLDSADPDR